MSLRISRLSHTRFAGISVREVAWPLGADHLLGPSRFGLASGYLRFSFAFLPVLVLDSAFTYLTFWRRT